MKIILKFLLEINILYLISFLPTASANQGSDNINSTSSSLNLTYDLKQVLHQALSQSPEADSYRLELENSQWEERNAWHRFFPSLDLKASHGFYGAKPTKYTLDSSGNTVNASNQWVTEYSLSLTETLYDNGESYTKFKMAQLRRDLAELNQMKFQNQLSLDVGLEYIKFSLNSKLLDMQQNQFKLLKKQFKQISSAYYQGFKTRKDFLRFKSQINRAELDLLQLQSQIDKNKNELSRLIGQPPSSQQPLALTPLLLAELTPKEEDLQLIYSHSLDAQISEKLRTVNSLEAQLVTRKNWPELNLSAGLSYQSEQNNYSRFSDNLNWNWNGLITLKYNLWDWGIRSRNAKIALNSSKIKDNQLYLKDLQFDSQIKTLLNRYSQLRKHLKIADDLLSLEKDNIILIQQEYQNGKVQFLDLIKGLTDLTDSQTKYYTTLAELQSSYFQYLFYKGTLYDYISKIKN